MHAGQVKLMGLGVELNGPPLLQLTPYLTRIAARPHL